MTNALSEREQEVYRLLGKGLLRDELASELHIEKTTVDTHIMHITSKLGLDSTRRMLRMAIRADLLEDLRIESGGNVLGSVYNGSLIELVDEMKDISEAEIELGKRRLDIADRIREFLGETHDSGILLRLSKRA